MSVGNNESASDPGAAAPGANRSSGRRRGVTSVLAMLYLLLFSALALGFYAQTNLSVQIARGEFKSGEAQVATESGLRFIRFHLSAVNIPITFTAAAQFEELYMQLGDRLEGHPNLGPRLVGYTAAAAGKPAVIRIPDSGHIPAAPNGARFRVVITDASPKLDVKVIGSAAGGQVERAVRMEYERAPKPYVLVGINSLTLGSSAYTDSYDATKGPYAAATAKANGSVGSNGSVTLNNTAKVNGDVRYGVSSTLTVAPTAVINGRRAPVHTPAVFPSVTLPPAGTYTDLGDVNNSGGISSPAGGTYVINNLTLSGTAQVHWQGPVKLYIRNSYNVSGDVVIKTFNNLPANRQIFFLPTCTNATWSGTNECVGDLYAPDTNFTVSGSVKKFGRIIAKTINNTSSGGMHYDESLTSNNSAISFTPLPNSYLEVAP